MGLEGPPNHLVSKARAFCGIKHGNYYAKSSDPYEKKWPMYSMKESFEKQSTAGFELTFQSCIL